MKPDALDRDMEPGPFVTAVRLGKVKGPQQRQFDLKAWTAAASSAGTYPADALLFTSGVWFAGLFEEIRKMTDEQTKLARVGGPISLEAVIAAANREWVVLHNMLTRAMAESDTVMFEALDQIKLKSSSGNPIYFSNAVDTLVDGMKFPLTLASSALAGASRELSDSEWAAHVMLVALGGYYYTAEHYWMQCVWNQYGLDATGEPTKLISFQKDFHRAIAVTNYRRNARASERAMRGSEILLNMEKQGNLNAYRRKKRIFSVFKKGGLLRIKVDSAARFPKAYGSRPGINTFVFEPHLDSLMAKRYASLEGLSMQHMMDAFELLNSIPGQMRNYVSTTTALVAWAQAKPLVPRIKAEELVAGFRAALDITQRQAEFILRYAEWKPGFRHDIWFSPLIRLQDGTLSFVCCAVEGVNHVRLVDKLIGDFQDIRQDADQAFEKYLRDDLRKTVARSVVGADVQVLPHAFRPSDPAIGDVDVLFRCGATLWVVETKSAGNAFDPLEYYNHQDLLKSSAVPQVQRKAKFIRTHLAEAATALGYSGDPGLLNVRSLVVMSNALLCGYPIDGVPVVDRDILHLYFADGEMQHLVYGDVGGVKHAVERIRFYGNVSEAHANLEAYLLDPPQISLPRQYIKEDVSLLPTQGMPPLAVVNYEVEMPVEALQQLMERVAASREGRAPEPPTDRLPQRPLKGGLI